MKRKLERLFESAQIPPRYANARLDDLGGENAKALELARSYVDGWDKNRDAGRWLFLTGPVGTGKTTLAFAVLNELIGKGAAGVAATVPELLDELRPGAENRNGERMEALKTADLLLLDDLGTQKNTDWATERLYVILNARYNYLKPTIITSNDSLEDLQQTPGWRRIVDRIIEMAALIRMDGQSHRIEKARRRRNNP